MKNNSQFATSDTPLATWLIINQVRLIETDNSSSPSVFILDNSDPARLEDLRFQWDSGNALGNCVIYHKTYRNLVHKVTREV